VPIFTLAEVIKLTRGQWRPGEVFTAAQGIRRVWTDSRTIRPGDLFIALIGNRFDGHRFVVDALAKGAVAAVVVRGSDVTTGGSLIEVQDTLRAYQELAAAHRRRFDIPIVAVGGSNGKTTTKEMIAAVLSAQCPTLATEANFNNDIGVPQTLLRLTRRHRVGVIEMGISAAGDMTRLCDIAHPTHVVITNIGPEHLETLHDLDGVAEAEGESLEALPADGTAVLNADDDFFKKLSRKVRGPVIAFGYAARADVRAVDVESRGASWSRVRVAIRGRRQHLSVVLRTTGRHNVSNALAALATGLALKVGPNAIREGLGRYRPRRMRSEVRRWRGATVLNDCYNANPGSVRAALCWLADVKGSGRSFAVLGDMLELGPDSERLHQEIGRDAVIQHADYLFTTGVHGAAVAAGARSAGMGTERILVAKDHAQLAARLREMVKPGDVVLVKGSRGSHMERVLQGL
jgi:UDP-N-acetylmuramoyl-tripeptide--D-alanyl-D-alanine ligase